MKKLGLKQQGYKSVYMVDMVLLVCPMIQDNYRDNVVFGEKAGDNMCEDRTCVICGKPTDDNSYPVYMKIDIEVIKGDSGITGKWMPISWLCWTHYLEYERGTIRMTAIPV